MYMNSEYRNLMKKHRDLELKCDRQERDIDSSCALLECQNLNLKKKARQISFLRNHIAFLEKKILQSQNTDHLDEIKCFIIGNR